jgi:hypothetical protein
MQHICGTEIKTKLKNIGDYKILIFAVLRLSYICIMKYYNCIKDMLKRICWKTLKILTFLACDVSWRRMLCW